jgi:outer membrane protein assembly factor BamD (BamD/ComL family)
MSVAGISSSLFDYSGQSVQNNRQQIQQEFQQLGQDLESGNLSAAQSDFTTLQQLAPQNNSTNATQSNSPIAQAFQQLAQDLQSGNLSAAQQDYTTIQQDFQNQASQAGNQASQSQEAHGHHHHGGGDDDQSEISQLFSQLGQALQSGNLSTAQQVFSTLQESFQQFGQANGSSSSQAATENSSSGISLNA